LPWIYSYYRLKDSWLVEFLGEYVNSY
jgi:hypothetical protein